MHRSLIVNFRSLLLASLLIPFLASAQVPVEVLKPFNYEKAAAVAKERIAANLDLNKVVIVMGPVRNVETRIIDGKETTLSIPYCRALVEQESKNPETLSRYSDFGGYKRLQLVVYRANQSQPVVQISGTPSEISHAQFPFAGGDIIVIEDVSNQTPAKK